MNNSQILEKAVAIARKAGAYIREEAGNLEEIRVHEKDVNSLVSRVDVNTEKMLAEELGKLTPGCGFLTEEETIEQNLKTEQQWILDPLDGTTNFLYGIPAYSVSIALYREMKPIIGIIYDVSHDNMYTAIKGEGAFCDGKQIHVSKRKTLKESLLGTGFPYYDYSEMTEYLKAFEYLVEHSRGVRRFGSAAIDLAWVAAGKFDVFYEYSLNAWDVAAGILLVQEAGGVITDFQGGDDYLFGQTMIAGNAEVHAEVLPIIREAFPNKRSS